jgi:hypothetical protein
MDTRSKIEIFLVLMPILAMASCGGTATLPSPMDVYDESGARVENPPNSAFDEFDRSRTYEFAYEDVFEATKSAFFRRGWEVVKSDESTGLIMAQGRFFPRGHTEETPLTAVASVEILDQEPTTRLNLKVDAFWDIFYGSAKRFGDDAHEFGNALMSDVQAVLASY